MILDNLAFLAAGESLGDTMARAGLNTVMGISIVFCALAFISIVIALEGKIFQAINRKKAAPKTVAAPAAETVESADENLADDEELVAVITAAIYAFEAEAGSGYAPADGLVVKSIRRRR